MQNDENYDLSDNAAEVFNSHRLRSTNFAVKHIGLMEKDSHCLHCVKQNFYLNFVYYI